MRTTPSHPVFWLLALTAMVVSACGDTELPVDENADWAEPGLLLGEWRAVRLDQRRVADPDFVVAVADTFTLSVTAEGRYVARLLISGAREDGWIRVMPPSVIFRPTSPAGDDDPGTLSVRADTVGIVGDSSFDFGTGTEEPSILEIDLIPG